MRDVSFAIIDRRSVATWIAFSVAVALALPQPPHPLVLAVAALAGAVLIALGFFFARPLRTIPSRGTAQRLKLGAASLLLGEAVAGLLLVALVVASRSEPALRARFVGRLHEAWWRPWALAFESSILEEVTFRLFLLSLVAWIVAKFHPRSAFAIALIVSTLAFGAAHLPAWSSVGTPALFAVVMLLNGVGGVLFGWIFWRWGLPYAILCHFAGDVVIQTLAPRLLS